MTEMTAQAREVRPCGDEHVGAGRGGGQMGWYEFALPYVQGKHVLDVGCGLGKGMAVLRGAAASIKGQDLDERLAGDDIVVCNVDDFDDKSFDVVTCFDVVEHVPLDAIESFVGHLGRIAREGFFVTTPNWTASRCHWPYHVKEYTPREFYDLLAKAGEVTQFKGTPYGDQHYPVKHRGVYYLFNDLRTWPATALLARCWQHVLPPASRIQSHNAAWVTVK